MYGEEYPERAEAVSVPCMTADEALRYMITEQNTTIDMIDIFLNYCNSQLGLRPVKEYQFHPVRKWRFDYAFPAQRVALEVEGGVHTGGRHIRPRGFLNDMEKYNTAAAMGWRVLRCTPETLRTFATIELLKTTMYGYKEEMSRDCR